MSFDKELLEILACPKCQEGLTLTPEEDGLVCETCKLKYPVRDGVPVLLINEAEPVD